jgi:hypothetical protein
VTDNKLSGAELAHLSQYENLSKIKFGGNNVKTLDELKPLVNDALLI